MLAAASTSIEPTIARIQSGPASAATRTGDAFADQVVSGILRTFNAKEHIYREGDPATHVYRIEAGHVCIYRMFPDGRRQVVDFAYPGGFVGLGAISKHAAGAQATSRTRVRCLPVQALHDIIRLDARVGLKLYEAVSHELLAARDLLFTVSQRTATERLAGFLLAISHRNARRGEDAREIVLPMTRSDIADFLGLTIETVSRTFTKFRMDGVIDLEQCILVTIKDPGGLMALAGGGFEQRTPGRTAVAA